MALLAASPARRSCDAASIRGQEERGNMKVKLIQTKVQEFEVELPDDSDSIVDIITAGNEAAKNGTAIPVGEPSNLGCQVSSITRMVDGKEQLLMASRMGQIVVTEEGGLHFREMRDSVIAHKKQLELEAEQSKQEDSELPAEERRN
jgi:hypothetical protein